MLKVVTCKKCSRVITRHKNGFPDQCPHCGANLKSILERLMDLKPKGNI